MCRHTLYRSAGLAAIASLFACSDPGQTVDSLSAIGNRPGGATLTCTPPTPDSLIPLPVAAPGKRVDLGTPVFSNPTRVTNPHFPISELDHVVLVGFVDGVPFRAETSLLPDTNRIDLGDRTVETLTSQYVAYLDRRIDETAIDWYGQDDDGAVWYFGEDVSNYEDGEIVDTHGTWLACKDGPVAMIMPAHPAVGDVYRVENIFPTVFEEIEILKTDQTEPGPLGPVSGAFEVSQLHLDGHYEPKIFAPGYGEFSTGSGTDIEELAIALPINAAGTATPADLRLILSGARRIFEAAGDGRWSVVSRSLNEVKTAWARYQSGNIPRLLRPLVSQALDNLAQAARSREKSGARQFALDVSRVSLDLLLQYRSRNDVDFARLDLWSRQLQLDAEAADAAGVRSDLAIAGRILDRLATPATPSQRAAAQAVRDELAPLRAAAGRQGGREVVAGAGRLQRLLYDGVQHAER